MGELVLGDTTGYDPSRPFDRLSVAARVASLTVLVELLSDWPQRFHALGRRVGLRSCDLRDLGYEVPFWLEQQARAFDRTWYRPSAEEERHASALLQSRAGIRARTVVREWLGAFVSKPGLRSSVHSLDDPVQLPLGALPRTQADAWLRQMLVARICRVLRQNVLKPRDGSRTRAGLMRQTSFELP